MDDRERQIDLGELKVDLQLDDLELKVDSEKNTNNNDVETLDFGSSEPNSESGKNMPENSFNNNSNDIADDMEDISDDSVQGNGMEKSGDNVSSNNNDSSTSQPGINESSSNNNVNQPGGKFASGKNQNQPKQSNNEPNKNSNNNPNNKNDNLNNKANNQNKKDEEQKNPGGIPKQNEGPNNPNNNPQNNNSFDKQNPNKQPQKNESQKNKAIDNKRNEAKKRNDNLKNKKPNNKGNIGSRKGLNKNFAKNYAKNKFNNSQLGSKVGNVADKVQKAQKAVKAVKNIKNIKNISLIGGGLVAALPVVLGILAAIFLVAIIMAIISPSGSAGNISSGYSDYTGGYYCTNITVGGTSYELEEYVARVIAQELGGANTEGLKAQAVLARTFVLNKTSDGNCTISNSQSEQTLKTGDIDDKYREAANATAGEILTHDGKLTGAYYATFPNGVVGSQDWGEGGCGAITCSNGSCTTKFYKYPSKTAWNFTMPEKNSSGNYWNGSSLQSQSGHCHGASQLGIMYYDEQGKKYNEILAIFFDSDVKISKLETGGGAGSVAYQGAGSFKKQINYYNQIDYNTTGYCGRTPGAYAYWGCYENTICTSGCGGTSLAMIASSIKGDTSITPITIMQYVKQHGGCGPGISGSTIAGLVNAAKTLGLTAYHTYDSKDVATKLSTGEYLVIANVTTSEFTGGGHYIVLSGYNNGQVYVLDPNGGEKTSMPNSQKIPSRFTSRDRNGWWNESAVFDYSSYGYIIIGQE